MEGARVFSFEFQARKKLQDISPDLPVVPFPLLIVPIAMFNSSN
jgi:hypothetical protein